MAPRCTFWVLGFSALRYILVPGWCDVMVSWWWGSVLGWCRGGCVRLSEKSGCGGCSAPAWGWGARAQLCPFLGSPCASRGWQLWWKGIKWQAWRLPQAARVAWDMAGWPLPGEWGARAQLGPFWGLCFLGMIIPQDLIFFVGLESKVINFNHCLQVATDFFSEFYLSAFQKWSTLFSMMNILICLLWPRYELFIISKLFFES